MKRRDYLGAATLTLLLSHASFAFDPNDPIPEKIAKGTIRIELEEIVSGVSSPNYLSHAGDERLFVVQQPGQVGVIENGVLAPTPFLDVSSRLPDLGLFGIDFDERGLLGLAFHPDYANNGKLYTFTSENVLDDMGVARVADFTVPGLPPLVPEPNETDPRRHQSVITEWQVDAANPNIVDTDPAKVREIMRIDTPQFNHNGGAITFGSGSDLFIAIGDGGGRDDVGAGHGTSGNGQDLSNVLGTILRVDVDGNDSANGQYGIVDDAPFGVDTDPSDEIPDEIHAYGLRNPFRISYDGESGTLIAGDVGQGDIEEVNIITPGGNFGWNLKEGSFAFSGDGTTSSVSDDLTGLPSGLIDPIFEYDHDEGISVIGGFIYRGEAIPELIGKYVFGEFTDGAIATPNGRLFYGDLDTGLINEFIIGLDDRALGLFVKGFGIDDLGELYVLADLGLGANSPFGSVLKIVAAPVPLPGAVCLFGSALGLIVMRRRAAS